MTDMPSKYDITSAILLGIAVFSLILSHFYNWNITRNLFIEICIMTILIRLGLTLGKLLKEETLE